MRKFVVIGCGAAGFSAARKLKEGASDASVALYDLEGRGLYTKIRLPEYMAGKLPQEKLVLSSPEAIAKLGIEHRRGEAVEEILVKERSVRTSSGKVEAFDSLVIAAGADAANPCLKTCGSLPVHTLRTLADAESIVAKAKASKDAVVIGGGLLGLEAAWALKEQGLNVRIVECLPRLLPRQLDEAESSILQRKMTSMGFSFHVGRSLSCAESSGGRQRLKLDDGLVLEADLILVSAGISPRTALAAKAGIPVKRGIIVNERLETAIPGIYSVGDCAEVGGFVWGLWAAAKDQGEAVAEILLGSKASFASPKYDPTLKVSGVQLKEIRAEAAALKEGAK